MDLGGKQIDYSTGVIEDHNSQAYTIMANLGKATRIRFTMDLVLANANAQSLFVLHCLYPCHYKWLRIAWRNVAVHRLVRLIVFRNCVWYRSSTRSSFQL